MAKIIAFKFPRRCHLGFHDVTALSLLLFKTKGQGIDVMKSKMAACGKFNSDN